jgi:integrase
MPRLIHRIPELKHHKPSNRAYVMLACQRVYCGPWGSAEARQRYDAAVARWLATQRSGARPAAATPPATLHDAASPSVAAAQPSTVELANSPVPAASINSLLTAFWDHVQTYYRHQDGTPTKEVENIRQALRPVWALYGNATVASFGPKSLMAVREEMIRMGWCRTTVNRATARVKGAFRWGVEQEFVPASIYHGLQSVKGLRAGRTEAVEPESVEPVPVELVHRTLPHLSATVAAMVKIQLRTGCRAGELVQMRPQDIEKKDPIWVYRPRQHKTLHHGLERLIYLDKECQDLLAGRLDRAPDAYVFSPAEAEAERRAALSQARKTPLNQGNRAGYSAGMRAGAHPRRAPGAAYTVDSYRRAITRACDAATVLPPELAALDAQVRAWQTAFWKANRRVAKLPDYPKDVRAKRERVEAYRAAQRWHPHQLRHTAATLFRQMYGLEVARVLLGHQDTKMTRHYSRPDHDEALRQLAGQASAAA